MKLWLRERLARLKRRVRETDKRRLGQGLVFKLLKAVGRAHEEKKAFWERRW